MQPLLRKKYSVELKNAGVGDVSVRQDSKIMASAGWDGRYIRPVLTMLTSHDHISHSQN